ncbi:LysR family transcriptional regulator [soil metagenome]
MARLDLEWIAVFDEVYKTASVSRAAERLGMAQGAASTALNKLRAHYDDRLFSRTVRGMLPTPRAESLYPTLRAVREKLEQARSGGSGFDPAEAVRRFRIGMTDISEIVLLPTLLNHLSIEAPGVSIEIEKISPESARRLEDGEIDLAVGFLPQLDAGFYQQVLFEQNFVVLVAADHPRIGTRLTKTAFARESHVVVTASGTGHYIVDKVLARAGVERRIVLRVPSFLGVARIVAETELIATVPRRFGEIMQTRERMRILALPHAVPHYSVKQHWHERFHADAGNMWLRRTVADLMSARPRLET